jgi:hypothetical protein
MPSEAQIAANRANAQSSTGPRTPEGKAQSAFNSLGLGLFTTKNCVQPFEREEYDRLCAALWEDLNPEGPMEELAATEVLRGAWRLRRCAVTERTLALMVDARNERDHGLHLRVDETARRRTNLDPMVYGEEKDMQIAIDRARAQAQNSVKRATAELRRLQNDRLTRIGILGENAAAARLGVSGLADVYSRLEDMAKIVLTEHLEDKITKRTQSAESDVVEPDAVEPAGEPHPEDTRLAAASFPPSPAPTESEITKRTQFEADSVPLRQAA